MWGGILQWMDGVGLGGQSFPHGAKITRQLCEEFAVAGNYEDDKKPRKTTNKREQK